MGYTSREKYAWLTGMRSRVRHNKIMLYWQVLEGVRHYKNTFDWHVWVRDTLPQKYAWLPIMSVGYVTTEIRLIDSYEGEDTSEQKYAWLTNMNGYGLRLHKIMRYWQVLWEDTSLQKYSIDWFKGGIRHYKNTFEWQVWWEGRYVTTEIRLIDRYERGEIRHNRNKFIWQVWK